MSTKFDPYYQWLGIPPEEQPPHHYRLLGLKPLENNLDVIETAADRQMLHLRTYQSGKHAVASQELLNEISAVKVLLLDPVKKRAYDAIIEARLVAAKNAVDAKARHERPLATPPITPSPTVPPLRPATQRPLPMAKMLPDPSVAPMISNVPLATSGPLRASSVATRGKANSVIVIAVIGVAAMLLLAIVVGAIGLSLTGGDDELAVHHSEVSAGNEDGLTPKSDGDRAPTATSDDRVPPTELPDIETPTPPIDPPPADREKVETEAPSTNEMPEEGVLEPIEVAVVEGPPAITEEARLEFATEVARLAKAALKEYDTLDAPTVLTAATGEKAEKRAAFALAAAFKAAQSGDIETLNAALALLDDPHFPKGESLRYKAKFVAGTLKPAAQGGDAPAYEITQEQRLAIAEDLLASATREGKGEDYDVAQSLLSSAGHYLQRMTRNGFREVQQRAALMAKLDDLRRSIEDQRKHIEYLAAQYEEYAAGLDATGHPRDAAACWNAGIYFLRVKGDWKQAIVHLAACDKPEVSTAAALDAKRTAEDLGALIASAKAWLAAAETSPEKDLWLQRAAEQVWQAERLKPAGQHKLDLAVVKGLLPKNLQQGPAEVTLAASPLGGRKTAESRHTLALQAGGSDASEAAVAMALKWIASRQSTDGGWNFNHNSSINPRPCPNPGSMELARNGATGLSLLPFLGAGQTHKEGAYQKQVRAGLAYLIQKMKVNGQTGSWHESSGSMYSHGIASIAMCEAYTMTHDKELLAPAQLAINFIIYAQDSQGGGWRYQPRQAGDTSVLGWQFAALQIARTAQLKVPVGTITGAEGFLDSVQSEKGARYGYTGPGTGQATSAIGLLCRMQLGWKHDHEALQRGIDVLEKTGPNSGNLYYTYYATQVMWHAEGDIWKRWNDSMRDPLVKSQEKEGVTAGSWHFEGGDHGYASGGRLYCTALAALILETYYRHSPLNGAAE